MTPLHLAVKSCEELKSTRPVRFLLIAGASRLIADSDGKIPRDYADLISEEKLRRELKEMLGVPTRCSCLMLSTPLTKIGKSPKTMIFYICLWLVVEFLLWGFVYPTI